MDTENKITVALDEEYGYREWVWHTGMTAAELTAFWEGLPTVQPYFMTPVGLPGELIQVCYDYADADVEIQRIKDDDSLTPERRGELISATLDAKPPRVIRFDNGEPAPERQPDWWKGHIHMDDDSGLTTSEGHYILHAGFREDMSDYEDGEGDEPAAT